MQQVQKNPAHAFCLGSNEEGGSKMCAMCVFPHRTCEFSNSLVRPQTPDWYTFSVDPTTKNFVTSAIEEDCVPEGISNKQNKKGSTSKKKPESGTRGENKKRKAIDDKFDPHHGEFILVPPNNKKSSFWKHFLCFDTVEHPDMQDKAHYKHCPSIVKKQEKNRYWRVNEAYESYVS